MTIPSNNDQTPQTFDSLTVTRQQSESWRTGVAPYRRTNGMALPLQEGKTLAGRGRPSKLAHG